MIFSIHMQDNYLMSREIPWKINWRKTRAPQIVESCHPGKQKERVWKTWRTWRAWKRWKTTTSPLKTLSLWLKHDPGSTQDWRTPRDLWRLEPWVKCSPATEKEVKMNLYYNISPSLATQKNFFVPLFLFFYFFYFSIFPLWEEAWGAQCIAVTWQPQELGLTIRCLIP